MHSPNPITISLDSHVSCRLYSDTRPPCLEVAQLHKGLVLMLDGKELVEEGIGFGTPVVQYDDKAYFSSSANVRVEKDGDRDLLVKSFVMDAVSRKRVGNGFYINDHFYDFFQSPFNRAYHTGNKSLKPVLHKIIELRKVFGVNTEFVKVKPRGIVTTKYGCLPSLVQVEVSLAQLNKVGCKNILILNEQGASFFRKYSDTNGVTLTDEQIGANELVKADEASLSDADDNLAFSLRNFEGSAFFRGREKIRNRCSWVGLGYSLQPSTAVFRYMIKLKTSALHGC